MAAKTYNLDFSGYVWQDKLPVEAGIYLTYTVKYNTDIRGYDIDELVYIGETHDIKGRQDEHFRDGDYPKGAKLAYAYALLPGGKDVRKRCEAAMIFKTNPGWNTANTKTFDYDTTIVNSTGKHYGLSAELTVNRTI